MSTADSTSGPPGPAFVRSVVTAVADEVADVAENVEDRAVVERLRKASALLAWLDAELGLDRGALASAEADLRSALTEHWGSAGELHAAIGSVLSLRHGATATEPGEGADVAGASTTPGVPTVDEVSAYLDARSSGDRAYAVRALVGGFSKVTLLVTARLDGVNQDIVLRQIPAGRSARSLVPEFEVLRFVHSHGLPAPRPLFLEPSDNALGGAFFAMSRSAGTNIGDVWGQRGGSRELCLEIAELYARLHQIPVEGMTAPVSPRGTPEELRAMIAWQVDVLDKRGIAVEPVLQALLDWLDTHIPVESSRRSLIHGDAAFSNLLISDGRISAILDWEAAHVGDAADELAYLRPSVEPVMPWSDFVERYVAAGGIEPSVEAMTFFTVWSHVWRYIGCLWMSQNFSQTGRYPAAVAAYVHGPRFLEEAVKTAFP